LIARNALSAKQTSTSLSRQKETRHVKKFLISLAAAGLTLIAAARAPAQEDSKPVLVLSLPSVDALIKDIGYLGKVAGLEAIPMKVEDAIKDNAGGLKGLDRAKPMGIAATTDGASFQFLAFLPASDAEALLALSPPAAGRRCRRRGEEDRHADWQRPVPQEQGGLALREQRGLLPGHTACRPAQAVGRHGEGL
jgi:hypothetical protein